MRFGGKRFGGPRFERNIPKPVKVGEEYDIEIKETGSKGDGIARVNNFVVFVNGAKLGEKAHIKITEVRNRFAIGEKTGAATIPAPEEKEETEMRYQEEEEEEEEETEEEEE
ncbi:MAG: TRAM domain-containing protein [Candidatus Aenigmatarchaeota archaeon]|nr:TRAM domain-containing protein [Candidatus Aenigmarchaeota archaeon]